MNRRVHAWMRMVASVFLNVACASSAEWTCVFMNTFVLPSWISSLSNLSGGGLVPSRSAILADDGPNEPSSPSVPSNRAFRSASGEVEAVKSAVVVV